MPSCAYCQDTHWVCEEHPDKPMGHDGCRGAGDPCPACNSAGSEAAPPRYPAGFQSDAADNQVDDLSQQSTSDGSPSSNTKTPARQISSSAPNCTNLPPTWSRNFSPMIGSRNKR